jgi:hypothetical protein
MFITEFKTQLRRQGCERISKNCVILNYRRRNNVFENFFLILLVVIIFLFLGR